MSIGTFILVREEILWIRSHIERVLPFVDEMVFFDGGSTDGTLEVIKEIQSGHLDGRKIKLFEDKREKDLKDDYVRLFDECLRSLSTDLAWFLHPDMWVSNPERIPEVAKSDAIALSTDIESFAGNPGGQLYCIEGRGQKWKNIYRLRNPDLGAHYHGWYGAANEDVYFREITGGRHDHYGAEFGKYPYPVQDSGIKVMHFSDVRTRERRLGRMVTCLVHQGYDPETAKRIAEHHPRVTLDDGIGFKFIPVEYPDGFTLGLPKVNA